MPILNCSTSLWSWRYLARIVLIVCAAISINACQSHPPADATQKQINNVSESNEQKLDRLLALMEQRLSIAPKVAKSKWNSGSAVDDLQRESHILDEVTAQAALMDGCNPVLVKIFFQDQMDAGKIIQRNLLSSWRNQLPPGYKFDDAPNLAVEIRPQLDRLTRDLITAFCTIQPIMFQPKLRHYLLMKADPVIRGEDIDDDVAGEVRRHALKVFQTD